MYKYLWDNETGGVILLSAKDRSFNEIRPVFHEELMLLGMHKYFKFSQDELPYMWHDGWEYIYRGKVLFRIKKSTDITINDEIEYIDENMIGSTLYPIDIDAMLCKNKKILNILENNSLKLIYDVYEKFKDKIDITIVNYSGGKDSIVLLDLVKRILMPKDFCVMYSDTMMEFEDTKVTIQQEKENCEKMNINFIISKADLSAFDMWKKIGPPSKINRWCCSVIKSTPNTLLVKKITHKDDAWCLSYQGNRALEGTGRSKLSTLTYGQKYSNRIACNAILEWNSLEVFLYIFRRKLYLTKCYRKGLKRIGCIACPMVSVDNIRVSYRAYKDEMNVWFDNVLSFYNLDENKDEKKKYYINSQKWRERDGGVGTIYKNNYREYIKDGKMYIEFVDKNENWKEWIKTLGEFRKEDNYYIINYKNNEYKFTCDDICDKSTICITYTNLNEDNEFVSLFKIIFRKSHFCIGCHTCDSKCTNNAIFTNGDKVIINEKCVHCCKCHSDKHICYSYLSKYYPSEVIK